MSYGVTKIAIRSKLARWWVLAECEGLPVAVARWMRGRGLRARVADAESGAAVVVVDADEGIK